ncbi:hypothetical protein [Jiella sp. M17.18]|uniref:hypothetical protein n=1 Tax=Jiella sp. M17.18 TaxID=3234247 RepID=UPI0034DF1027
MVTALLPELRASHSTSRPPATFLPMPASGYELSRAGVARASEACMLPGPVPFARDEAPMNTRSPRDDHELQEERRRLALADRDISEGEGRIARQAELIARLRQEEQDTASAERYLHTLQETLAVWHEHRRLICEAIRRLEAKDRA